MGSDESASKPFSLRRWSQRKLAAARDAQKPAGATAAAPAPPAATGASAANVASTAAAAPAAAARATDASAQPAGAAALPPVESLTFDSDFTAFLQPKVDEALRRRALKQLFRDPRFNVMDGLDVYIDDYSKPDPISADLVKEMVQGRYIFDPPATRVNAQGVVEDVPPDERREPPAAEAAGDAPGAARNAALDPAQDPAPPNAPAVAPPPAATPPARERPGPESQ